MSETVNSMREADPEAQSSCGFGNDMDKSVIFHNAPKPNVFMHFCTSKA